MKRFVRILQGRSLTASIVAVLFGALCFSLSQTYGEGYDYGFQGADFLFQSGIIAPLGLIVCVGTFLILLKDEKSGYPAFRLSVATLFWAISCLPVVSLFVTVAKAFLGWSNYGLVARVA